MDKPAFDRAAAAAILRNNDLGGYTIPTQGLYPYQWNWDSAITALGWLQFDEPRAWLEAETNFSGQWDNGMLPHILFHKVVESYFPGPDVWGGGHAIPSTSISQPPVWATAIRLMHREAKDRALADAKVKELLPALVAYHDWWYRERDPEQTGLVCSYHPWESGMDNSPAWDEALARVPPVEWAYQRADLGHIDAEQRPHQAEYDRYLYLVDFFKHAGFDSAVIYRDCPYSILDIGIIAILHRATLDLIELCDEAGAGLDTGSLTEAARRTEAAIGRLWDAERSCFGSYDNRAGSAIDAVTTGTVLPLFGRLASPEQAAAMGALIKPWLEATACPLSSTHPDSPLFEPQRYWRGPVWLHINWMIADGLAHYGMPELAMRLEDASRRCVTEAGPWEYYHALTGAGCGGDRFSWTAAIALYWLLD